LSVSGVPARWSTRTDGFALAGLIALAVVGPVAIGAASGALTIPHNDDAAYRRVALNLFESGHLELNGWGSMSLVGQLAFVQPFLWVAGAAAWSFAAATAALTVVGIVAAYALARDLLPSGRATFALLTILCFPGFLLNTTTFMTDVPAIAGEIACLAVGAVALRRRGPDHWRWLGAALVAGCLAFSIREFALAAPIAVVLAALVSGTTQRQRHVIALAAVLGTCGAIHLFTTNLPGQWSAPISPSPGAIGRLDQAIATLALALSPALVIALFTWRTHWRLMDLGVGVLVGAYVFGDALGDLGSNRGWPRMLLGNLLEPTGALDSVVGAGDRPLLLTAPVWDALNAIALVNGVVLFALGGGALGLLLRRAVIHRKSLQAWGGSTAGMLAIFALLYGGGLGLYGLVVWTFDRYLWPLVLPLAVLSLLQPTPIESPKAISLQTRRVRHGIAFVIAGALVIGLGSVSGALLLNADAYDAARWRMGDLAVERGISANTVDAGLEWVTNYASGLAAPNTVSPNSQMWYEAWWPSFHLCAVVSSSPLNQPGVQLEAADVEAYRLLLFAGPQEPLYLYRVSGPDCPG
jgi:4-amino-4-deoxy-L-arabinose transferase-like glycosyltransferase